jgi:hypothetical protein
MNISQINSKRQKRRFFILKIIIGISLPWLFACEGSEALYPSRKKGDAAPRHGYGETRMQRESLTSEGGLFGRKNPSQQGGGAGIGVNSFLWRSSLDTISFLPLSSADPFGGVIITEWHALPEVPDERIKVSIFIVGTELRADGLRVAVFRQRRDRGGSWSDLAVDPATVQGIENSILTRAREMRLAQR